MVLILGVLAGICLYGAVHHLQVGLHLGNRLPHLLLVVTGVCFALLCLHRALYYRDLTAAELLHLTSSGLLFGLVGIAALFWFVGLRAGVSRWLLLAGTAPLAVALVFNHFADSIILSRVAGFELVPLPWGEVYHRPVALANPLRIGLVLPAVAVPLALLLGASVVRWRRGELPEFWPLLSIVLAMGLPALLFLASLPLSVSPVPFLQLGLAASMVLLSILTSWEVARTAAMRRDLARSEERFRRLVETSPEAVVIFDPRTGRCVGTNDRAAALSGRSIGAIRTSTLEEFLGQARDRGDAGRASALRNRALAGETPIAEWDLARADGSVVPCELRLAALAHEGGARLRLSLLDLSERKESERTRAEVEARLQQAEKLETLGTLAGSIAHDLKNMLTPIVGLGEMALEELHDHPARVYVSRMLAAAQRANQVGRDILTFSRRVETPHEVFRIEPVVQQAVRFLGATLPSRISLRTELAAPDVHVRGSPPQVHQVIMSLGANAAEAMAGEGELRIILRRLRDDVELTVLDTGPGMDETTLQRVFEPFFTTKQSPSSGLGLSVVHGIVTEAAGSIEVNAAPGRGTAVRIRFPVAEAD